MKIRAWMYEYHRKALCAYRSMHGLTQERMAEKLGISVRCYWDQEHGQYGFSGASILLFLLLIGAEGREDYFVGLKSPFQGDAGYEADQ